VKFTANAICRQTLAQQATPALKADVRKVLHHSADAATKEAASVVVIAEAAVTAEAVIAVEIAEAVVHLVVRTVAVVTVRVDRIAVAVVIAPEDQAEDNN
jgi:hypothetical protein